MNKKKLIYSIATIFFLFLFIYILFPFSLLKEIGVIKVQQVLNQMDSNLLIKVQSLDGYWFSGIKVKGLELINPEKPGNTFKIDKVTTRISVFPLIIGRLNLNSLIKIKKGEFNFFISLSLWDLMSNKFNINELQVDFKNFVLNDVFDQVFDYIKNSNNQAFSVIVPMISKSKISGILSGEIDYDSDESYNSTVNMNIKDFILDINNESLNIPLQKFTNANVSAEYKNSKIKINKDTLFKSQNITFSTDGIIKIEKENRKKKTLNLNVRIGLSDDLEKNFSFIIPQILNCNSVSMLGGNLNVQLTGAMDKFTCTPI